MTNPSSIFATLIRETPAPPPEPPEPDFYYHCPRCNDRRGFVLVAAIARHEFYRCEVCGYEKGWKTK